jgi:serine/threonine-protein kinase
MTAELHDVRDALAADYDVTRLLGRGGMATVFLAEDRKRGGNVAIKVLDPDLAGSVGHERFLREIRIASALTHPGILTVQDSGEAAGLLYYVMPYVEGESLRERLARERQLPIDEAVSIASEVAIALESAHAQGFVHRDIKPDNIMLAGGRALLADFGIARAVDQAGTEKLTETGLAVGTPSYMSPEQWTGDLVDGRSDLYSLGCVTFEMLVGEPPFTGPTAQVILARHSMQDVPSLRLARPTIPPGVENAVRRAMSKVPADRFSSARQFADALATPAEAGDDGARLGLGTLTVASAATATATATAGQRRRRTMRVGALAAVVLVAAVSLFAWSRGASDGAALRSRVVVLPFRNVGAPGDEYFADGIGEEITSRLSGIASLGVIARTSAIQYRNSTKSVKEIGTELGVGSLIEGSVRWDRRAGDTPGVRITVRLIRVSDGTQLWATDVTVQLKDVFAVQASVAEKVVAALDQVLIAPEKARLAVRPTEDMGAYDYYLRGNAYYNKSWERADVDSAIVMYQRAADMDPKFAAAWAQLGRTHTWKHRLGFDETPERLALARAAIARAHDLQPDLPETLIAEGLYSYWGEWRLEDAVEKLTRARSIQPSNARAYLQIGNIRRRQGQFVEAIRQYEKAAEFDPRYHIIWFNIGGVSRQLRQFDQADAMFARVLTLQPSFLDARLDRVDLPLAMNGDVATARQRFDSTVALIPPDRWRPLPYMWLNGPMRTLFPAPSERLTLIKAGSYGLDSSLAQLARAEALTKLGAIGPAASTLDSATKALQRAYDLSPKTPWLSAALGIAHGLAGRKAEAVASVKRAQGLMSDALDGPQFIMIEAYVQLLVGDRTAALNALQLSLQIPGGTSAPALKVNPDFAPLRSDPRFQAMLAKGSPPPPER